MASLTSQQVIEEVADGPLSAWSGQPEVAGPDGCKQLRQWVQAVSRTSNESIGALVIAGSQLFHDLCGGP